MYDRCTHTDVTPDGRERRCVKAPHGEDRQHLLATIVTLMDRIGLPASEP